MRHILVRPDQEDLLKDIETQLKGALPLTHRHCPFSAARLFLLSSPLTVTLPHLVTFECALLAPVAAPVCMTLHRSSGCTGKAAQATWKVTLIAHMHTNVQAARSGVRWPRSTLRAPRGAAAVATWAGWCEP